MTLPENSTPSRNEPLRAESHHFLEACLFYNVNALSRQLLKMAEAAFAPLKLSPAHASLLLVLYDNSGINPKKLGKMLQLTPSTITRFIDVLARKKTSEKKKNSADTLPFFPRKKDLKRNRPLLKRIRNFIWGIRNCWVPDMPIVWRFRSRLRVSG